MSPSNHKKMHDLLGRCRGLPEIPQPLFDLLELFVADIDDRFTAHEAPTQPRPRPPLPPVLDPRRSDAPGLMEFKKATAILVEK